MYGMRHTLYGDWKLVGDSNVLLHIRASVSFRARRKSPSRGLYLKNVPHVFEIGIGLPQLH